MSASFTLSVRALIGASLMTVAVGASAQGDLDTSASQAPMDGMRVSIDPVTKQLRPVTAAESKALDQATVSVQRSVAKPQAIASRTVGAKGLRLGEEHMSYSRAAIGADGKLVMDCVEGDEAASLQARPVAQSLKSSEAESE